MSLIISPSLVVSAGSDDFNTNSPIIGWQTLAISGTITATTEHVDHPASNLSNPATHLYWKSDAGSPSSDEVLEVAITTSDLIDYIAIAAHNLGSAICPVTVTGYIGGVWVELISERLLASDEPAIFRFTPVSLAGIRLIIGPSQAATPLVPQVAVLYTGALLLLQRRLYVGHTPITYGRRTSVVNPRSINGAFLGRVVLSEARESQVTLQNLTPSWYREYLDPFFQAAQEAPFFWAWRPGDYPAECGYAWLTDDPTVSNQSARGLMQASFSIAGIA